VVRDYHMHPTVLTLPQQFKDFVDTALSRDEIYVDFGF